MVALILAAVACTCALGALVLVVFVRLPGLPADDDEGPEVAAAPPTWLEQVTKKKIIVHTRDDKSIEGVLWAQTEDEVILRAAKLLADNKQPEVIMAGETCIPRSNVSFAQLDD